MIHVINGPAKSGKTAIANALRNSQISNGKGALLIDDTQDGDPKALLEKILDGEALPQPAPKDWQKSLKSKKEPAIILVGDQVALLSTFENMLPGFIAHFGPVFNVTITPRGSNTSAPRTRSV